MNCRAFLRHGIFAVLCIPAVWSADAAEPAAPAEAAPLRVLSYNIRYRNSGDTGDKAWAVRSPHTAAVMLEFKPDVICTQEALKVQIDDLAARLPDYAWYGVGREDGKDAGEFCAIYYRKDAFTLTASGTFWLSDTPEKTASTSWGNKITRICSWVRLQRKDGGEEFEVWNAHWDHQSEPSRQKSAVLMSDRLKARARPLPFVVCGDFNCGEQSPGLLTLKGEPLRLADTFRVVNPGVPPERSGTFNSWSDRTDSAKIDYILTEPQTKVIEAAILHPRPEGIHPSDHYPVNAVIRFTAPTAAQAK